MCVDLCGVGGNHLQCAVQKFSTTATSGVLISAQARINDRIRVPEVRLVGPGGEQVGIVRIDDATGYLFNL